jgi:hypothetical protein
MIKNKKKSRLEFLHDIFKADINKNIKNKMYSSSSSYDDNKNQKIYYDSYFSDFYHDVLIGMNILTLKSKVPSFDDMFDFFVFCDPSPNKEYVNWFLNLYRNLIKEKLNDRKDQQLDLNLDLNNKHAVFFEDIFSKASESLEVFSLLKKTNILSIEFRDVNKFKELNDFINFVKPYIAKNDDDNDIHTLSFKELQYIQNFTEKNNKPGQAELVFENSEWVIVVTHDRDANVEFGRYTTWCTAGTRFGTSMFESYHGRGSLFVLIKKGFGSKKLIDKHPQTRLQFHFEDNMYMDALDKSIDINNFLFENKDIKKYFRTYITKFAIPKRLQKGNTKQKDILQYLLNLGFGDEIIKILIDSKPLEVDFSGYKIEDEYLRDIGNITSIESLNLSECSISELPESISNLKNLKKLKIRNNKELSVIPDWINKLTSLELLDCAGCNIKKIGDLNNCTKLTELVLDFNKSLTKLPNLSNLNKLSRLTASSCNLKNIDNDILNCKELFILDVHNNNKLHTIPIELSQLPNIIAICIDDTEISSQTKKIMEKNSNGSVCIIKYGN